MQTVPRARLLALPKSREPGKSPSALVDYLLTGFRQTGSIRHYSFQAVDRDRHRFSLTVNADVELMRRFGLPLQDMPLLCRRMLEARGDMALTSEVDYTEAEMQRFAQERDQASLERERRRSRTPRITPKRNPAGSGAGGGANAL